MKKYLLICFVIMSSFIKYNTAPVDYLGVKGPLSFNKTAFNLTWTSKPNETYYIQEYVPANDNVEHFN